MTSYKTRLKNTKILAERELKNKIYEVPMKGYYSREDFAAPGSQSMPGTGTDSLLKQKYEMQLVTKAKKRAKDKYLKTNKQKGKCDCPKCNKRSAITYEYIPEIEKYELICKTPECININELED